MKDRGIRKGILTILRKDIQKELAMLCSVCHNSMLRGITPTSLSKFSWDKLLQEVQHAAPNLFSILSGELHVHASPCETARHAQRKRRLALPVCFAVHIGFFTFYLVGVLVSFS